MREGVERCLTRRHQQGHGLKRTWGSVGKQGLGDLSQGLRCKKREGRTKEMTHGLVRRKSEWHGLANREKRDREQGRFGRRKC